MKIKNGLAALALTAAVTLSACGGSDTEAYCQDLEAAQDQIDSLASQGAAALESDGLEDALATIGDLEDTAPPEVEEEWGVVSTNLDQLTSALDEAGLDLSDVAGVLSGQRPEGVDEEAVAAFQEAIEQIDVSGQAEALDAIQTHALDECDISFGGGASGS